MRRLLHILGRALTGALLLVLGLLTELCAIGPVAVYPEATDEPVPVCTNMPHPASADRIVHPSTGPPAAFLLITINPDQEPPATAERLMVFVVPERARVGVEGPAAFWTEGVYLRYRWMAPGVGRFVSMDTWSGRQGSPLSLNKYIHANSSPTFFTDPTGHFATAIGALGVSSVAGIMAQTLLSSISTAAKNSLSTLADPVIQHTAVIQAISPLPPRRATKKRRVSRGTLRKLFCGGV